jgi:hypothetical protein
VELPAKTPERSNTSAYIVFSNQRRKAFKAMVAPDRPMLPAEVVSMESNIRVQWATIRDDEQLLRPWQILVENTKKQAPPPIANAMPDETKFRSPCNLSDSREHLINPATIIAAMSKKKAPRGEGAVQPKPGPSESDQLLVDAPVPNRTATVQRDDNRLAGCYLAKRNLCRLHAVPPDLVHDLGSLVGVVNRWVDSLAKDQREDASQLVAFVGCNAAGAGGDEPRVMMLSLLVLVRGSPKMQLFADCCCKGAANRVQPYPMALPCEVQIMTKPSRLALPSEGDRLRHGVAISTSDEVCHELLSLRSSWSIVPLRYNISSDTPSLLDMIVEGIGEEFRPPDRRAPAKVVRPFILPDVFDVEEDPLEHGRRLAEQAKAGLVVPHIVSGGDGPSAGPDADDYFLFSELEEMEPDEAEDLIDLIAGDRAMPKPDEPSDESPSDDMEGPILEPEEAVELEEVADREAADEEDIEGFDGLVAGPPLPSPQECVVEAQVDDNGRITCLLPPFAGHHLVGRITQFPKGQPPARQSVAVRCALHPGCSFTRRRARFTNDQLMLWLFSGQPVQAGMNADEALELKQEHARLAMRML